MRKFIILLSAATMLGACQTMEGVGEDISNIELPAPDMSKIEPASTSNPNAGEKRGAYKAPAAPVNTDEQVNIKRDFPAYHSSPRFDNEAK